MVTGSVGRKAVLNGPRLLLEQIRMTASPEDLAALRHQADEIEARILDAAKHPDPVN